MKKLIAMLLVLVFAMSLCACGAKTEGNKEGGKDNAETAESAVMSNENVTVEGIYVDSSYTDGDDSSIKMVYVFLTVKATDENLVISSNCTYLTVNESNTYDSAFHKYACDFAPSYYYSSFNEDVYVGNEAKLALTFEIPEGDLTGGKTITLENSSFPLEGIEFTTDEIVFCDSPENVGEQADPAGHAEAADKYLPADAETEAMVKEQINGYYWEFFVSAGTMVQRQEIEFFAPNEFEVRSSFGANGGTYEITKGYIRVTYSTNNETYNIPYEFVDGEISLDCNAAFSIYE